MRKLVLAAGRTLTLMGIAGERKIFAGPVNDARANATYIPA
jgi:hypothetical protein